MTKMDNYDEHVIATMISRDEEILAPYGKQTAFGRISIQPVSSTLLFDANKEKDEILMEMSCFEEVRDTLLKMIYNTVGFGISAEVFNAFNQYNTRVIQSLSELQTAAAAAPTMARELAEKKQQKQQEFIQNWGANGAKMKDINDSVRKHIQAMENNARALFSQSNPIITNLQREIDELSSSSQAEALSRNLSSRLADAYGKAWKDIMEECEDNVENLLIQYNAHLCDVDLGDSYVGVDSYQAKSRSLVDRLTSGRNSYFTGAFVASVFAAPLAIVAAPITLVIAGIGALLGIGAGIMTKRDSELKQWKQNLKEHLSKCYSQIYDNFMVKTENGKTKLHVAEEEIMSQSMKAIQNIYEQHKSNVDKQLQLLEQQMQADAQSKKQKMDEVAHIQQTWKPIHENLVKAKTLLAQMDQKRKSL
jgi:hypothetical protein